MQSHRVTQFCIHIIIKPTILHIPGFQECFQKMQGMTWHDRRVYVKSALQQGKITVTIITFNKDTGEDEQAITVRAFPAIGISGIISRHGHARLKT